MVEVTRDDVDRALRIARWYGRKRAPRADPGDLESAALEGLAKASHGWDDGVGSSFWNYAFKRIVGAIRDDLRRADHLTREARALVRDGGDGDDFFDDDALAHVSPLEPLPLDHGVRGGAAVDAYADPRDLLGELELREALGPVLDRLPERERFLVVMIDLEGLPNAKAAEFFGISAGRSSQLRAAAYKRMRALLGTTLLDAA